MPRGKRPVKVCLNKWLFSSFYMGQSQLVSDDHKCALGCPMYKEKFSLKSSADNTYI